MPDEKPILEVRQSDFAGDAPVFIPSDTTHMIAGRPPTAERFERLEETLEIAHRMWSGVSEPFEGDHYRLEEPMNNPPPISRPHPPIMVGGMGEQKTLRLVARYADACKTSSPTGAPT